MRSLAFLRVLNPLGWLLALAAGLGLLAVIGQGLGLRWDPFDRARHRLDAAEAQAEAARADAAARRLEVEGADAQVRKLERHHQTTLSAERATAIARYNARSAHDASTPLDPDRAARLRDHDGQLCGLSPAACAPASPDAAVGGHGPVPA